MRWDAAFDDPVKLPNGRIARTLKEAARYVTKLPKAEQLHPKWQHAARVLMEAAEHRGPIMHAHMGVMQAINKDEEPRWGPGKVASKGTHWSRKILARDR